MQNSEIGCRPDCVECGRKIMTHYCLIVGTEAEHRYMCWGCVDDRRRNTAEEFDVEGYEWD